MKRFIASTIVVLVLLVGLVAIPVQSATEVDIEQAITDGVAWLAEQQNDDGSWGDWDQTAMTALVLVKLQERAYELDYPSPFDEAYPYSSNVTKGWEYIFTNPAGVLPPYVVQAQIGIQVHGLNNDDPDTNGNGYGLYFTNPNLGHENYTTGICLMALASSGTPNRPNDGGLDFDGDGNPDTFMEIAQETVDWMAFAQGDSGNDEGGWGYFSIDNGDTDWTDQSNAGYSVLGLAYAEGFGCTVPGWVRTELNVWIGTIQDPVSGGSFYNPDWLPHSPMLNELKAGNLIFQMTFCGISPDAPDFQRALSYIETHWRDQNIDPGWGFNSPPANYQSMYCLMKGLGYSDIRLLDTDGDGARDDDWLNQEPPASPAEDFSSVIVSQQNPDGSWYSHYGSPILGTTWALLTLEFIFPDITPPEVWCEESVNPHGNNIPGKERGKNGKPKPNQNPDGFYKLMATDNSDEPEMIKIYVVYRYGPEPEEAVIFPENPHVNPDAASFSSGDVIKLTEAPGAAPSMKKIGSSNGNADAVVAHITIPKDTAPSPPDDPTGFYLVAVDSSGNYRVCAGCCLVPPPPM